MPRSNGIWREPPKESLNLYPGLVVMDNRVSGSITAGPTRLPLWCMVYTALTEGWPTVEFNWSPSRYGLTAAGLGLFINDLLEARGEFGRLLCILADAERRERVRQSWYRPWWRVPSQRKRVRRQLVRCIAVLDAIRDDDGDQDEEAPG